MWPRFTRAGAVLGALLALVIVTAGLLIWKTGSAASAAFQVVEVTLGQPVSSDDRAVRFVVRRGETAAAVGEQLQAAGLVRSALGFRLAVELAGLGSHLEAGEYELRPNMSLAHVISILAQGRVVGDLLTIPEGWRATEIADALEHGGVTSRADFMAEVEHPDFPLPPVLAPAIGQGSLEGFLYPDSYRLLPQMPAAEVARTMVATFARRLTPDLLQGFAAHGLTLRQAVTLASIVEREAVRPDERPVIASVYLNRLQRGMRLQADPTVQFALVGPNPAVEPPGGYWKSALSALDLRIRSPYNTYVVTGLPPGPICNPGLSSLEAVAHPASTEYLYFVARPDGSHAFARTLEEHQRNVALYQGTSGPQ